MGHLSLIKNAQQNRDKNTGREAFSALGPLRPDLSSYVEQWWQWREFKLEHPFEDPSWHFFELSFQLWNGDHKSLAWEIALDISPTYFSERLLSDWGSELDSLSVFLQELRESPNVLPLSIYPRYLDCLLSKAQ